MLLSTIKYLSLMVIFASSHVAASTGPTPDKCLPSSSCDCYKVCGLGDAFDPDCNKPVCEKTLEVVRSRPSLPVMDRYGSVRECLELGYTGKMRIPGCSLSPRTKSRLDELCTSTDRILAALAAKERAEKKAETDALVRLLMERQELYEREWQANMRE